MENINENVNVENPNTEESNGDGQAVFTRDEVLALIQSESDKRVNQALAKQKKQFDKQISLSKLDGAERESAEKDAKIAELQEQLANFEIERNKSELKTVLSSRGLSAEFADIINITDDIEASQEKIEKLDRLFKAAVRAEVEKRLAGNAPKGNGGGNVEMTKDDAKKLSMAERQKLYSSNPELYKKLFN